VVAFLASEYQQPQESSGAVKAWDTCDGFIYVYLPEAAVDKFAIMAKEGYVGSSGDFQFTSTEADNGQHLHVRDAPCGVCKQCFEHPAKMSPECELQALGWIDAPREVCIDAATTAPPAEPRARAAAAAVSLLSDFAKTIGLAPGVLDNVIVTKKNADPDEEDADEFFAQQDYYLARPVGQAFQSNTAGTVGLDGPVHPVGTWFVKMKWYEMTGFNAHGTRHYQLATQYKQLVWPVSSLVRCGGVHFDEHVGKRFSLSFSMHEKIMKFGCFD
jgi:hypothetical protein